MKHIHITKLSNNEFHFGYEYTGHREKIEKLKYFCYKNDVYRVKEVSESSDLSGHHGFLVTAEEV